MQRKEEMSPLVDVLEIPRLRLKQRKGSTEVQHNLACNKRYQAQLHMKKSFADSLRGKRKSMPPPQQKIINSVAHSTARSYKPTSNPSCDDPLRSTGVSVSPLTHGYIGTGKFSPVIMIQP